MTNWTESCVHWRKDNNGEFNEGLLLKIFTVKHTIGRIDVHNGYSHLTQAHTIVHVA